MEALLSDRRRRHANDYLVRPTRRDDLTTAMLVTLLYSVLQHCLRSATIDCMVFLCQLQKHPFQQPLSSYPSQRSLILHKKWQEKL